MNEESGAKRLPSLNMVCSVLDIGYSLFGPNLYWDTSHSHLKPHPSNLGAPAALDTPALASYDLGRCLFLYILRNLKHDPKGTQLGKTSGR